MPRILPRLLKAIQNTPKRPTRIILKQKKTKQAPKPLPEFPSISLDGRSSSILIDHDAVNDIKRINHHKRRRNPPPKLSRTKAKPAEDSADGAGATNRGMTLEERTWWSNPYCTCF